MCVCQYCKSELSDKSALNKHQKRAKYCLSIQKRTNKKVTDDLYECNFCKKKLTSKDRLVYHYNICKIINPIYHFLQILYINHYPLVLFLDK